MKLSEKESRILACIEHQADEPISEIRKALSYRDHTVRYAIKSLTDRGLIVGKTPFIDVYPLGYTDFTLYLSLSSESEDRHDAMIKRIVDSPHISWVAKLGGDYQYGVAVIARYIDQVSEYFHNLSQEFGNAFFNKTLSVKLSFTAYGRRYFAPRLKSLPSLSFGKRGEDASIDDLDHRILCAITHEQYDSNRQLAAKLDIPFSTFERRMKILEEKGIIRGYIYRYRLEKLGVQNYRLFVFTRGLSAEVSERLRCFCEERPKAIHFIECMGEWDYEIGLEVRYAEEVTDFIREVYKQFGTVIRHIKMVQIFRHLKYSSYPFPLGE